MGQGQRACRSDCDTHQLLSWSPQLLLQGQHDRREDHAKMTGQGVACHRRKESQHPGIDRWGRQLWNDEEQLNGCCPVLAAALGSGRSHPTARVTSLPQHLSAELAFTQAQGTVMWLWLLGQRGCHMLGLTLGTR